MYCVTCQEYSMFRFAHRLRTYIHIHIIVMENKTIKNCLPKNQLKIDGMLTSTI